jgi:hypothetical protein
MACPQPGQRLSQNGQVIYFLRYRRGRDCVRRDRTGGIIGGGDVPSLISFTPQMQIPGSNYPLTTSLR